MSICELGGSIYASKPGKNRNGRKQENEKEFALKHEQMIWLRIDEQATVENKDLKKKLCLLTQIITGPND